MRGARRRGWWALLAATACVLAVSACGGTGSSETGGSTTSETGGSTTSAKPPPRAEGEPSAAFAGKGPNGELATAGTESTVAEREEASKVVAKSFKAAENGDWKGQCETFSHELTETIEEGSKLFGKVTCVLGIERLASQGGNLKSPMAGSLAALRVNGNRAFAFFYGPNKRHFVVPLAREDGEWKLAALGPEETP